MLNDSLRTSIRSLTESFASQLEELVRQAAYEHVSTALGNLGAAAPARAGRRKAGRPGRKPGRPAGGGKRSASDMDAMQDRLLAHVKANPGQRGEQIAAAFGSDVGTIRLPMKKLIAARKVTTKGERRGMMYFPGGAAAGAGRPAKAARRGKKARRSKGARKTKGARKAKRAAKKRAGRTAKAALGATATQATQKAA